MVELLVWYLVEQGVKNMLVLNCMLVCVNVIVEEFNGCVIILCDILLYLVSVDIVIFFIVSLLLILGKGVVENVLKVCKYVFMFMIDIVVFCDIEEEVGKLLDVYLYIVDDL